MFHRRDGDSGLEIVTRSDNLPEVSPIDHRYEDRKRVSKLRRDIGSTIDTIGLGSLYCLKNPYLKNEPFSQDMPLKMPLSIFCLEL
jgi:hypothetical protein